MVNAAHLWKLNHRLLTVVMNGCADQFVEELGLEIKEFFVLDEVGSSRYPAELAAKLMLPKASVTVYLRNLVAKGYIRREIDEADLRRHRLGTTASGHAALEKALALLAGEFEEMLGRLQSNERDELQRILEKLLQQR